MTADNPIAAIAQLTSLKADDVLNVLLLPAGIVSRLLPASTTQATRDKVVVYGTPVFWFAALYFLFSGSRRR